MTVDGGVTWGTQESGTTATLHSVFFTNRDIGWAVGEQGTVIKTEDGGETWARRSSSTDSDLLDVSFVDEKIGWAVGINGNLIKSSDGGSKWATERTMGYTDINSVEARDKNLVFAAGDAGLMIRFTGKPPLVGGNVWFIVAMSVIAMMVALATRLHASRRVGRYEKRSCESGSSNHA